jgi:protein-tyrosine phosphatase
LNSEQPRGFSDLHSHLVPGVDDGARTVEDALEGVGRLWEAGIRTIVTTPHLDGSLTQTPAELEARLQKIDAGWEVLIRAAGEAYPELELLRGHEVMLDVPDPVLTDPRIRLAETSYVLVEWPRLQVPPATTLVLGRLLDQGVRIILAHPERYRGFDPEMNLAGEWRKMGALLQVNYGSLVGRYGAAPRKRAFKFLERGWVDLFSTDFHGRPDLPFYLDEAEEALGMLGGQEQFEILARWNPARVLEGGDLLPAPPLTARRGLRERVLDLFRGKE